MYQGSLIIMKLFVILTLLLIPVILGRTKEDWRNRTIYQLLTDRFHKGNEDKESCKNLSIYCGGTFKGIKENLHYIKELGFDAIWISPIPKNQGEDYHGYAFNDMYQINPHFGTSEELKELVKACHKEDIFVMVDVVANHVAYIHEEYSKVIPFNSFEHYHSPCEMVDKKIWENQTMRENCRLFGLPDLDQNNTLVKNELLKWIKGIIKIYEFDGIRVDTAAHVPVEFWKEYTKAAGVYSIGEVMHGSSEKVAQYQDGFDGMLNYPLCYGIRDVFASHKPISEIKRILEETNATYKNMSFTTNFIDSHDIERFFNISGKRIDPLKNAITFALTAEGIPILYYGTEQTYYGGRDPANRESLWNNMSKTSEMYQYIKKVVHFRKLHELWEKDFECLHADNYLLLIRRGDMLFAFTDILLIPPTEVELPESFNDMTLCNYFNYEDYITPKSNKVEIELPEGLPKLYVPCIPKKEESKEQMVFD